MPREQVGHLGAMPGQHEPVVETVDHLNPAVVLVEGGAVGWCTLEEGGGLHFAADAEDVGALRRRLLEPVERRALTGPQPTDGQIAVAGQTQDLPRRQRPVDEREGRRPAWRACAGDRAGRT